MRTRNKQHMSARVIMVLVFTFLTLRQSVQAQSGIPQTGVDPSSGLSYIERSRTEWVYAAIAMRPDGLVLAVGDDLGNIELFDNAFQSIGLLHGHTDETYALAWTDDGSRLASASEDATVRVWDTASLSTLLTLQHNHEVIGVAWNPDGTLLATIDSQVIGVGIDGPPPTDDTLYVWDIASGGTLMYTRPLFEAGPGLSWSPSGGELAVSGGLAGPSGFGAGIIILEAQTGNVVRAFPSGPNILRVAWSPDGNKLAYGLIGTNEFVAVIVIDAISGQFINRSTTFDTVTGLAWDATSQKVAFGSVLGPSIFVWDLPTNTDSVLSGHNEYIRWISWSHSSNHMASASVDGAVRIWDMAGLPDLSGTPTVTPYPTAIPTAEPTPTPTATSFPTAVDKFAFTRQVVDGGGDREQIFTLNLDGSGPTNFSDNLYSEHDPVWSPDGTRIAFTSTRSDGTLQVFVRDLSDPNPNNATQVTSGAANNYDPAWSPDSQKIAFTSERDGNKEIYITRADGSTINNPTQVTHNPADDFDPDWSIDNTIAFISTRNHSKNIYVANLEFEFSEHLTDTSSNYSSPRWSPDGQRIAFVADLETDDGPQLDIYVMNSDGQNVTPLNINGVDIQGLDWSPDGRQVVFDSAHEGNSHIYVANANGSSTVRVTYDTETNYDPAWAPGQGSIPMPCD